MTCRGGGVQGASLRAWRERRSSSDMREGTTVGIGQGSTGLCKGSVRLAEHLEIPAVLLGAVVVLLACNLGHHLLAESCVVLEVSETGTVRRNVKARREMQAFREPGPRLIAEQRDLLRRIEVGCRARNQA